MKRSDDIVTVLVGDAQPIFVEHITALVREVVGNECELQVHYTDKADILISLAKTHPIDLFVLFMNNILFPSGNLPSDDRMEMVMRLVWNIAMQYKKPVIGICALPEYEDYSRIAGVDFFFKAPFENERFMAAVKDCLSNVANNNS